MMVHGFFQNLFRNPEEPLSGDSLKKLLRRTLTPLLEKLGLTRYDGGYLWYSDFNEDGIRRVFKYNLLKGNAGLLVWGVCFRHVPTVTPSRRLQYHRTDKNITLHLWDWPRGYSVSLEEEVLPTDITSHENERAFKTTLLDIFGKYRTEIDNWYRKADTLSGCLEIVDNQIKRGGAYSIRWPTGNYIKIFLLALCGEKSQARELLARASATAVRGNSDWKHLAIEIEKELDTL